MAAPSADIADMHATEESGDESNDDIIGNIAEVQCVDTQTSDPQKIRLKKSEKKFKKYQEAIARKKEKRKLKKELKKSKVVDAIDDEVHVPKKENRKLTKEKLKQSLTNGHRVCIDLSLEGVMSVKQTSRLCQQLGRLYGSNRKAENPACLHFTSLDRNSYLFKECVRKNSGFEDYFVHMSEKSHTELFKKDEIVYLSPDSDDVLEEISKDKVYVIGGLVDDCVDRNRTKDRATESGIQTAKLPIDKYMIRVPHGKYSKVLTVNQVFDIILTFCQCRDWKKALEGGAQKIWICYQ